MILVLTDGLDFSPSRQIQDSLDAVQVFLRIIIIHIIAQHFELVSRTVVFETGMRSGQMTENAKLNSLIVIRQVFVKLDTAHHRRFVRPRPRDIFAVDKSVYALKMNSENTLTSCTHHRQP